MAAAPTLTCKQCNYANEPERVYCHNCGAKLDRTLLPKEPAKVSKENKEKTAKRVQKMVNPTRGFFTNWHKALLNTLCSAVSVAALIQMARPPVDGIPTIPTKEELLEMPPLLEQIEELQLVQTPQTRQLPEKTINFYLYGAIKTKGDTLDDYFKFDRAFVNLDKDVVRFTAQESVFNYPLYAGALYKVSIAGGKMVASNIGGNFGRLPVHPMIMEYCGSAFQQLWNALQREKSVLDRMQSITIQPGTFIFTTKPHA